MAKKIIHSIIPLRGLGLMVALSMAVLPSAAQKNGITDTGKSKYAVVSSTPLSAVRWTGGFWGERFGVFSGTSVQSMWETWKSDTGHGWNNFLIAAGEKKGKRHGPPFHDGDMYKWLEALTAVYAVNKDPEVGKIIDRFVELIQKSQRPDGYLHTPVIIAEMNRQQSAKEEAKENETIGTKVGTGKDGAFGNRLNFETYNLGHLITAGIMHKRATGKNTLFNCAVKAADFLYDFYKRASDELARNAICPSHYMAVTEMYRETGDPKYLELSEKLIDIRGKVENGTDDNQDRVPFRQQYNAMGHSVRANYLYAGVADLYLESGEEQLKKNLDAIWTDIVTRKMYITGACGALYDGTSPDGTDYKPDNVQKVHQSYGRPYQLPHSTAHNETCANIGNLFFNWRMFAATGDAKYTDVVENCLYNSILPGISLDGKKYFYTNPMRISADLPYKLRWPKERTEYISCFCCPPNTLRTLCEAQDYAYSIGKNEIYVNLYGDNTLNTRIDGIGDIAISQTTDYPWDGTVELTIDKLKGKKQFGIRLRVPDWCTEGATILVNGAQQTIEATAGTYATVTRTWKKGDVVTLSMPMRTRLIEANPLVEESRGQVAVQRGPIVYCLESNDLGGARIDDIAIPLNAKFTPVDMTIDGSRVKALEAEVINRSEPSWKGQLYREATAKKHTQTVRFIPYYAWGNRGKSEMTVWIPASLD
ncbi:glycoside hydrolase family 127 protein [uncultured Prevotella sp.]|uniref:aceric acid hydrolase n=1 Tax=uncultured Prevotella sp. TaxID=159272 RepID=UPI00267318AF|nr:glycoside hydrolase family 127 protein [uncultured Prevotella sp.]